MAFRLSDLFSCFPSPGLFPPSDRSLIDEEQSDSNIWWSAFVSYAHDNNFSSSLRALPEEDQIALKKFLLQMGSCDQKGWWNKEKVTVFFLRSGDYYYLSQSEGEINSNEFELHVDLYDAFIKPHLPKLLKSLAIHDFAIIEEYSLIRNISYSDNAIPFSSETIRLVIERSKTI